MKGRKISPLKPNRLYRLIRSMRFLVFDFDGVFTDNSVIVDENGRESVLCCRSDGIGLSRLKKLGMDILILSSEPNPVVKYRAKKLKVNYVNNCKDKLKRLTKEARERGFSLKQVAYIGNDINDLDCLRAVSLPIAVAGAHKDILRFAKYKTSLRGGYGAVREICDLIYKVKKGDKADA